MLAVLALSSCAQPGSVPPVSEPSNSASRIRAVNDSTEELRDLRLVFPQEEVVIGDVAPGAASDYVEVAHGVYSYSAFRYLQGGESVVQPVIDFVGEIPLPVGDYTYFLGVEPDKGSNWSSSPCCASNGNSPVCSRSGTGRTERSTSALIVNPTSSRPPWCDSTRSRGC
jgi:hypothetical protein